MKTWKRLYTPTMPPEPGNTRPQAHRKTAGNVFFAIFAAVAMVGAVGYGFSTVLRGPVRGMTEVTKRTVSESAVITSARIAIVGATTHGPVAGGDCDGDGKVEPLPFFDAGANPKPVGGGWLPRDAGPPVWTLVPDSLDSWKTEFGYCAWDSGAIVGDAGCGGGAGLLAGSPNDNRPAIAVISAGKDKIFQTTCAAYNIATPNAQLVTKAAGSDDIALVYSYAEANNLGSGLWKPSETNPTTATAADKGLQVGGQGTFTDKVVLTTGGLVLPGDPGDNSITGDCDAANDKQLRRNTVTIPPTIEICDDEGGLGWVAITGGSGTGGTSTTGRLVSHWKLDETSGTLARDSVGNSNGTLYNSPVWQPTTGLLGGALNFPTGATNRYVRAPRSAAMESSAITISAWVKRNGAQPQWAIIMGKAYDNGELPTFQSYAMHTNDNSDSMLRASVGKEGDETSIDFLTPLPDGIWTHLVTTYDPAASSPQLKVYVNGILDNGITLTDPLVYDTTAGGDLYIGNLSPTRNGFVGDIDDVRIYNYALSAGDIASLYKKSLRDPELSPIHPAGQGVGWGNDGNDKTGNGPDATNTNAPTPILNSHNFVQVDAGELSACGVDIEGRAWCWGADGEGQLGNGANGATTHPRYPVANIGNLVKVSAGRFHACALERNGKIWCWGSSNNEGLLGNNSMNSTSQVPVAIVGLSDYVDLSVGRHSSCAVRHNGEIWCWGGGTGGQLGNGANANSAVPVRVSTYTDFVSVNVSHYTPSPKACAVRKNGRAYCWGTEVSGEFGNGAPTGIQNTPQEVTSLGSDVLQIVPNEDVTCALIKNGEIWCAGNQASGALGNNVTTGSSNVMVKVLGNKRYKKVSTGNNFACGLTESGEAWCWGADGNGQLGNGPAITGIQAIPTKVLGENFIDLSAGPGNYALAIQDTKVKKDVPSPGEQKISAGVGMGCLIDDEYELWCWGDNEFGELGIGVTGGQENSPVRVAVPGKWKMVDLASRHTCAIKMDGTLWCWGRDADGELGNGGVTTGTQNMPIQIGTDLWQYIEITPETSCGIKVDGTLWCWGLDSNGGMGNGAGGNSASPVEVVEPGPWKKVSLQVNGGCAIKEDGSAWCWGADNYGQLGDGGVNTTSQVPVKIAEPGPWKDISGGYLSCGIKENGTLWCWGDKTYTNLRGNGTVPELMPIDGIWSTVSTNMVVSCAVRSDGTLWCWGDNQYGQVGIGNTTTPQTNPVQVIGGGIWTGVHVGNTYVCGVKADNSYWCWGNNDLGQIGDGTSGNIRTAPVRVDYTKGPKWPLTRTGQAFGAQTISCAGMGSDTFTSARGDRCYYKTFDRQTWHEAQKSCQANGGYLAVITSAAEQAEIAAGIPMTENIWIGIDDIYTEGDWRYSFGELAGTPFWSGAAAGSAVGGQYNNWNAGEPNNSAPDNCGFMNSSGRWVDYPCNRNLRSLCEVPGSSRGPTAINIGTNSYIGNSPMGAGRGLAFSSARTLTARQQDASQLLLEAGGTGKSSQMSFKTNVLTGGAPEEGLIGHWTMDEGAGSILNESVNGLHATLNPDYSWAPTCQRNGCIYFNGSTNTSYAKINRSIMFEHAAFTMSFWMARDGAQMNNAALIQKNHTNNTGTIRQSYGVYFAGMASTRLHFIINSVGGLYSQLTLPVNTILDNTWYHIVASFDPTGPNPHQKFYVNGVLTMQAHYITPPAFDPTSTGNLFFGAGQEALSGGAGDPERYRGWMDDVRIYNRALSDAEVANLYTGGSTGLNLIYTLGLDYASGTLSFYRNWKGRTEWAHDLLPDLELDTIGNVGVGTPGTVVAKLDVNGAIKIGNDDGSCTGARAGIIDYNSGSWRYCSTSGWRDFGTYNNNYWYPFHKSSTGSSGTTCAMKIDRALMCWGNNTKGHLGINVIGGISSRAVPVQRSTSADVWKDWIDFSNGEHHTCGVRADGTAWCWGSAADGQLGTGNTSPDRARPVQVEDSAGTGHWADWRYISSGDQTSCGIRTNGTAWCWGYAGDGALGDGQTATNRTLPVQVLAGTSIIPANCAGLGDTYYNDPVSGQCYYLDNTTMPWSNSQAECVSNGAYLAAITSATEQAIIQNNFSMANILWIGIDDQATEGVWRYSYGESAGVQFWSGAVGGTPVGGNYNNWDPGVEPNNWGPDHCGMLTAGGGGRWGDFWCGDWQRHLCEKDGGVGAGGGPGWTDWIQISTSHTHTCGLRANGTAWCWGKNNLGQLGNGTFVDSNIPVQVQTSGSSAKWNDWKYVSAGLAVTCGLRGDGSLWCWGAGDSYRLGNNSTSNQSRPVRVHDSGGSTGWTDWKSFSTGDGHACGVRSDGSLWCWGKNDSGQGGKNVASGTSIRPVRVYNSDASGYWSDWTSVYGGIGVTCGTRSNGSMWCWGTAASGAVGDGQTTSNRLVPVQVTTEQ